MSKTCVGAWHIRPTPARLEGNGNIKKTWTGPINPEIYGKGLKDLCNRTQDNLNRLSLQMQKTDPCLEFGMKHWHPDARPQSACTKPIERPKTPGRWESVEVMFTDNKLLDTLGSQINEETDSYVDPPARTSFCYLCSTMEEHERHMQQHRPKKRPASAKPRICYIAPKPKQKIKSEEDKEILIKERLYKVEVFTSDQPNAGTSANVFISIKGSTDVFPRTQLIKKRGSAQMCFMRASKETFHIKGPFLGNLQILTVEHDGTKKNHAWHLDRIEVTDVKALKTWVFHCVEWLSTFKKPHYSNRLDLQAEEKETPPTFYSIEVYTGKQNMAGTDSNIYITLIGVHGHSKKIHLADPSSDKKLFEKNSVDKFKIMIPSVGELKRIRIEHDGKGFAAGWFLNKVLIQDSTRPKDCYHFMYGGWIAKDEGDGRLWREIVGKKKLPQEIKDGTETKYEITVKTGDVRYAGTDANVFIQLAGTKGITPKLKLDDAKNNFERNMVDFFEVRSVNVGSMDHIVIGHDNFGPGAGWYLDKVTVKRYVPKDEARERLKKMRKNKKARKKKSEKNQIDDDSDDEEEDGRSSRSRSDRERRKKKKDLFTVSPCSSEASDDGTDTEMSSGQKRGRDLRRPGPVYVNDRRSDQDDKRSMNKLRRDRNRSSDTDSYDSSTDRRLGSSDRRKGFSTSSDRRPSSALKGRMDDTVSDRRRDSSSTDRRRDSSSTDRRRDSLSTDRRRDSTSADRRRDSTSTDRHRRSSSATKQSVSTSASSLRNKAKKDYDDDDENLDDIRIPLYEECVFECNNWLAADEGDGLFVRELKVTTKNTYYKEPKM